MGRLGQVAMLALMLDQMPAVSGAGTRGAEQAPRIDVKPVGNDDFLQEISWGSGRERVIVGEGVELMNVDVFVDEGNGQWEELGIYNSGGVIGLGPNQSPKARGPMLLTVKAMHCKGSVQAVPAEQLQRLKFLEPNQTLTPMSLREGQGVFRDLNHGATDPLVLPAEDSDRLLFCVNAVKPDCSGGENCLSVPIQWGDRWGSKALSEHMLLQWLTAMYDQSFTEQASWVKMEFKGGKTELR